MGEGKWPDAQVLKAYLPQWALKILRLTSEEDDCAEYKLTCDL